MLPTSDFDSCCYESQFEPMKQVDVLCIGYALWDMNFRIKEHPKVDEKTYAHSFKGEGGGPAANAAYCVSRIGGQAAFAGRLGKDSFGESHLNELNVAGVDTTCTLLTNTETSVSSVWVDDTGHRAIVNYRTTKSTEPLGIESIKPECLLIDGHEPAESEKALKLFPNIPSILDAGSLRDETELLSKKVSYIVASTPFATNLSQSENPNDWLDCLGARAPYVAVTRGAQGVLWRTRNGDSDMIKAPKVNTIDSTAAGDIFHGAFALALSKGRSFRASLSFANQVAAISVMKAGGRSSCPNESEIPSLDSFC